MLGRCMNWYMQLNITCIFMRCSSYTFHGKNTSESGRNFLKTLHSIICWVFILFFFTCQCMYICIFYVFKWWRLKFFFEGPSCTVMRRLDLISCALVSTIFFYWFSALACVSGFSDCWTAVIGAKSNVRSGQAGTTQLFHQFVQSAFKVHYDWF